MTAEQLKALIDTAKHPEHADLILTNLRLVNVFSGTISPSALVIKDGTIARTGPLPESFVSSCVPVIDAGGLYAAPAFIDSHIHVESSMLTPEQISRVSVPHGTSTIIADPHEIVNVGGLDAFDYMVNASRGLPLDIRYMMPSCVPATPFEDSGASITAEDMTKPRYADGSCALDKAFGLGEFMDYEDVAGMKKEALDKIAAARERGMVVDGHSPALKGTMLDAYLAAGIHTDHECATKEDLEARVERGMYVMLRHGSACHDLENLAGAITPMNSRYLLLCSDDRQAATFLEEGHMDQLLRILSRLGIDPVTSLRMCTINAAECYGLSDRGALVPGRRADIVLLKDLSSYEVEKVYLKGKLVAENGRYLPKVRPYPTSSVRSSVRIRPFTADDVKLHLKSNEVWAIGLQSGSVVTAKTPVSVTLDESGDFVYNPEADVVKLVVMERHKATGRKAVGFLSGYGLKRGAIALTISHDSHNIIAAGVDNESIKAAIDQLERQEGGIALALRQKSGGPPFIIGSMPLPVAGLMSDKDAVWVAATLSQIHQLAFDKLGVNRSVDPVMTLCFMSLPVIPHLKITDRGLFDTDKYDFIPLERG